MGQPDGKPTASSPGQGPSALACTPHVPGTRAHEFSGHENLPAPRLHRWHGQTFGTQFWTWLYGEPVGQDEFGNRYYRTKGGKIDPTLNMERRWVIYGGEAEASAVPPAWHGWLHHTVDQPPSEERYQPRPWQKPHRPNLTGTPAAHRPTGSTLAQGRRPKATGDYKAWKPGIGDQ
jgi:NADH:ubiquinone oxidoreductase subunit